MYIELREITGIHKHPNADSLAIVELGPFTVCHPKDKVKNMKVGDKALHVPPDICISPSMAKVLGVDSYLKVCHYKGDDVKSHCWVRSARLRGIPSMGFIIDNTDCVDEDYDKYYGVTQFMPRTKDCSGTTLYKELPQFPKYTDIKRIQLMPNAWTEGLPVRITEKVHGCNTRLGVVRVDDEWQFMVGSHNVILKEFEDDKLQRKSRYWKQLTSNVMRLLNHLCDEENAVIIYGEIYGPGIQDLDYGLEQPRLRVFDIKVREKFLGWDEVLAFCEGFNLDVVKTLYTGPFDWEIIKELTDGPSLSGRPEHTKSKFKGREGVVVTSLKETNSILLGGRLIAKSISVDYESRKGGTEYH